MGSHTLTILLQDTYKECIVSVAARRPLTLLTEAVTFIIIIIYQGMLDEADGPMNFTQMVTLFASKMAGGTDDDETILKSFEVRSIWKANA